MFHSRQIAMIVLLLGSLTTLGWSAPQKAQMHHRARIKPVAKQDPPPQPPPAPLTPEQLPAQPPQVSYLNGQLTIISRNSTLADILHAVSRQTGAVIELPAGAGFERVAGRMGPGTARDVLAELLNGSRYDYVMIASAANPRGLQHVILTPKSAGGEAPAPNPATTAYQQPEQQVSPNEPEMPPDATADDQEPPPEEPPSETPQPDQGQAQYPQPGAPEPGAQQGVKTPEQLLHELQRMQQLQQQQQQQQQQNQQNPR
jgi:hypothetical protein